MERTPFAGLTRLAPGESLAEDGFSFQWDNPATIDKLLRLAASTHRHDGHPKLEDPAESLVLTANVVDTGGVLPADTAYTFVFTMVDADGGETAPSDPVIVTTQASLTTPELSPSLEVSHAAGGLRMGNYAYSVTVTDDAGGETRIGPAADVTIDPGFPDSQVLISGLQGIVTSVGGTGWRLWRMVDGGGWWLAAWGTGDTITDDGTLCPDCTVQPPTASSRTNNTNAVQVALPDLRGIPGVVSVRLYGTSDTDGGFPDPSLLGEYPEAETESSLSRVKEFTSWNPLPGRPPDVSHTFGGANKINPDTDLIEFPFKRPVQTIDLLPVVDNTNGDIRLVFDDRKLYAWDEGANGWFAVGTLQGQTLSGHAIYSSDGSATQQRSKLQFEGIEGFGDIFVNLSDDPATGTTHVMIGFDPSSLGGGGGGAALVIRQGTTGMTPRPNLSFTGAGVTVTDDAVNNQTVVTIPGGGTGGGGGGTGGGKSSVALGEVGTEWTDLAGMGRVRLMGVSTEEMVTGWWSMDTDWGGVTTDPVWPHPLTTANWLIVEPPGTGATASSGNTVVPDPTAYATGTYDYIGEDQYARISGFGSPGIPLTGGEVQIIVEILNDLDWRQIGPIISTADSPPTQIVQGCLDNESKQLKLRYRASAQFGWTDLTTLDAGTDFTWPRVGDMVALVLRVYPNALSVQIYNQTLDESVSTEDFGQTPMPVGIVPPTAWQAGFAWRNFPWGMQRIQEGATWYVPVARLEATTPVTVSFDGTDNNMRFVQIDTRGAFPFPTASIVIDSGPDPGMRSYAGHFASGYQDITPGFEFTLTDINRIRLTAASDYVGDITLHLETSDASRVKTAAEDETWTVPVAGINKRLLHYQLNAEFVESGGSPTYPTVYKLIDEKGTLGTLTPGSPQRPIGYNPFTGTDGTLTDGAGISADWTGTNPLSGYAAQFWYNSDWSTHFSGKIFKTAGDPPAADEIMFKLPYWFGNYAGEEHVVVTGDDDGRTMGVVRFDGDGNVIWVMGTSSDPATKHPWVDLSSLSWQLSQAPSPNNP